MTAYLYLLLSWLLFGIGHSLMASLAVKQRVLTYLSLRDSTYRLFYNGFALLTFIPVLIALRMAPSERINEWPGNNWLGFGLISTGVVLGILALRGYDLREFSGLSDKVSNQPEDSLRQGGLLRYVRHPLYGATLLLALGLFVQQPNWKHLLFGLLAFLYIRIGIHFEERKLVAQFGDQYRTYRQRTPMLLPFRLY